MTPSQKILVIERSIRCRRYGFWSLIPIVGLAMWALAFRDFRFVRKTCGPEWNPADGQMKLGRILSFIGLFISVVIICVVVFSQVV